MSTHLILLSLLTHKVLSQCEWTVGSTTLNLRPLQGEIVTAIDDSDHTYTYSICENSAGSCEDGEELMARQVANSDPTSCFEIGRWDPAINPIYDDVDNVWTFDYDNGGSCGQFPRDWAPSFICDETVELEWGDVSEVFGSCRYELALRTRYACSNWTTTTPPPDDSCIWKDGDNTLNLTRIQGFIINAVSGNDPSQIYSLSTCSNNLNCNGEMGMMSISTISNCIQNIAKWDEGLTQPTHSSNFGGQWEFVYTNGDECGNGAESVVTVFWNCNPFAGTGRIIAAKEIGICVFEIQIDSNLACS